MYILIANKPKENSNQKQRFEVFDRKKEAIMVAKKYEKGGEYERVAVIKRKRINALEYAWFVKKNIEPGGNIL